MTLTQLDLGSTVEHNLLKTVENVIKIFLSITFIGAIIDKMHNLVSNITL